MTRLPNTINNMTADRLATQRAKELAFSVNTVIPKYYLNKKRVNHYTMGILFFQMNVWPFDRL